MRPVSMRMSIAAAMLVVLVVALTTTTVLGYLIYEQTLSGLVTSRFEFIAREFKGKLEAGIDLGLPLDQLENIDDYLHQEVTKDESLVAISIVDTDARVLFDTHADRVGKPTTDAWVRNLLQKRLVANHAYFGDSTIGLPLFTSFGKPVGILQVRYAGAFYNDKRLAVAKELAGTIAVVLLVAGVLGVFGVFAISRPLASSLARLERGLERISHRIGLAPPDASPPPADLGSDSEIERELGEAVGAIERAEKLVARDQTVGVPSTEASS